MENKTPSLIGIPTLGLFVCNKEQTRCIYENGQQTFIEAAPMLQIYVDVHGEVRIIFQNFDTKEYMKIGNYKLPHNEFEEIPNELTFHISDKISYEFGANFRDRGLQFITETVDGTKILELFAELSGNEYALACVKNYVSDLKKLPPYIWS